MQELDKVSIDERNHDSDTYVDELLNGQFQSRMDEIETSAMLGRETEWVDALSEEQAKEYLGEIMAITGQIRMPDDRIGLIRDLVSKPIRAYAEKEARND